MTSKEILKQLEGLGQDSIKKVLLKHGINEPLYGVKVEELKRIQKKVKFDQTLAMELYASGIYDAMYLAGLIAEPEKMTEADLQKWVKGAHSASLCSYTVSWVASESKHGMAVAMKWIDAKEEMIASAGWATLAHIATITDDSELDIPLLKQLLGRVAKNIHTSRNQVKSAMNGFVIAVGSYVVPLNETAKKIGEKTGKVAIDVGDTACKVPYAPDYIDKAVGRGSLGKKKKSARC